VGGGGRRVGDRHVWFAGYRSLDSKLLNDRKNGIVHPMVGIGDEDLVSIRFLVLGITSGSRKNVLGQRL